MHKAISVLLTLAVGALLTIGCSNTAGNHFNSPDIPDICSASEIDNSNQLLWGIWRIHFDTASVTAIVEPARDIQLHYDVTKMITPPACKDCLQVVVNSVNPVTHILDADVTLRNPYAINGYDVRGIVYTDAGGHELMNADDWTKLYDIPGGDTLNPFKAYAKQMPKRLFAGHAQHTEKYLIHFPTPPEFESITYAVTASWPSNCREPYWINNFTQTELSPCPGAKAELMVVVNDWQEDVNKVTLVAPEITGEDFTQFTYWGGEMWKLELANSAGAEAGDYKVRLIATSSGSGSVALYDYATIRVSEATSNSGWALTWGGPEVEGGVAVAAFGSCDVYFAGHFSNAVDFDPGPGLDYKTSTGGLDPFLCSFFPNGAYKWSGAWGEANGDDCCLQIDVDTKGNLYFTGYFRETVDLNPGAPVCNVTSNGEEDVFLSKFAPDGDFEWGVTWGSLTAERDAFLAVDSEGNSYVAGYFMDTMDFDPGPGVESHTPNMCDNFLSKFDTNGNFQWVKIWDLARFCGVTTDDAGNIYLTGYFSVTQDFDPNAGVNNETSNGGDDVFILKLDADGNYLRSDSWGGTSGDKGLSITCIGLSDIVVCGTFQGTVDFDPGPVIVEYISQGKNDVFISKFTQGDTFEWAKAFGGTENDTVGSSTASSTGDVYVVGCFYETIDFDTGPGVQEYISNGISDAYLTAVTGDGNFKWARAWGGSDSDLARGIAIDDDGYIYVAGNFGATVDFMPGSGVENHTSIGDADIFLVKFRPDGNW